MLLAEYAVGRAARDRLDLGDRATAEAAGVVFRLGAAAGDQLAAEALRELERG